MVRNPVTGSTCRARGIVKKARRKDFKVMLVQLECIEPDKSMWRYREDFIASVEGEWVGLKRQLGYGWDLPRRVGFWQYDD
jgi:hypothetical protein